MRSARTVGRRAVLILPGLFLWGMAGPLHAAKDTHKRMIVMYVGADDVCDHFVTQDPVRLGKKKKDEVKWLLLNICTDAQKVLVCVYRGKVLNNPFAECDDDGDIAAPFAVPGNGGESKMKCHAASGAEEYKYTKQVHVGHEAPDVCPPKPVLPPQDPDAHPGHRRAALVVAATFAGVSLPRERMRVRGFRQCHFA